jgi:hypothetical protein
MRRLTSFVGAVALVLAATPAFAQQTVNFYVGGFSPRGFDARGPDDVLFQNANFLTFNIDDFHGATVGGEWLVGITDYFDAGLGLGFYQNSTPAVYTNLVNSDGSEIDQELKLRIVPFTATVRVLPLGHRSPVRPYFGGGVAVQYWRYSETGEFVDTNDNSIFRDSFVGSGTEVGPVVLGGVSFPIGPVGIGGELRYTWGKGTLPATENFAGPKVDLSGLNYLFTIGFRF